MPPILNGRPTQLPSHENRLFPNATGLKIAANVFFPENFDESKQYPAILVGHPAGGVKEQTAGLYAERLAKLGYVTLAFDATHQGESEGLPPQLEEPANRVEDFRATVDYLTTLPYVDKARIGAVGICASGSYGFAAFATDHRIKAYATISGADIGMTFRQGWRGMQEVSAVFPLIDMIGNQRTDEAAGGEQAQGTWVPFDPQDKTVDPELLEGHDYYRTPRAGHERSPSKFPLVNFDRLLAFTAFNLVDMVNRPILFIAGSKAGTRWMSDQTYTNIKHADKELFHVEGASHFDMYDKEPYVSQATEKMG